jgi:hypothetical protein
MLCVKGKALYIEFLALPIGKKALVVLKLYIMFVVIRLFLQFIELYMLFKGIL